MRLYGVEEGFGRLFEERINREVEGFKVGGERLREGRVGVGRLEEERKRWGRERCWRLGELVEERGDEVRVVDADGKLLENVGIVEGVLDEAVGQNVSETPDIKAG